MWIFDVCRSVGPADKEKGSKGKRPQSSPSSKPLLVHSNSPPPLEVGGEKKKEESGEDAPSPECVNLLGEKNLRERGGARCPPRLSVALIKTFGATFFAGSFYKLLHDLLMFASPLLLK